MTEPAAHPAEPTGATAAQAPPVGAPAAASAAAVSAADPSADAAPAGRHGAGAYFARWIGGGALLGFVIGAVLAVSTPGPALVSQQRSVMWLGVFFAMVLAGIAAVVAVLLDSARARR